jgi:large subunit ribosomal protein L13
MKTWVPKGKDIAEMNRKWYVIDASGATLGRMATSIAYLLTGKNKPVYTPHIDMGDHVVVINADKVNLTGAKFDSKIYYRYSNYPGGMKSMTARKKLEKHPDSFIIDAVKGMMPKTKMGRQMLSKLKVYTGEDHPHQAQKPETVNLSDLR